MGVLNRAPAPIDADRPAAADFVRVLATWAVGAFHPCVFSIIINVS